MGFMKAHVLQHVPFEGLGSIGPWLESKGAAITYTRFFESPQLPEPGSVDIIIAMGGPMSVNDEDKFSWLRPEKLFIQEAIAQGTGVLGICLGAQLIAGAMGGRVFQNPVKEIGWFPIQPVSAPPGYFHFPGECHAFHWHGETFDLPADSVRIAKSCACQNQAFQLNRNVIGLQFHLESTFESASALLENCGNELVPGPFIQNEQEIRAAPLESYRRINAIMNDVLSYLLE